MLLRLVSVPPTQALFDSTRAANWVLAVTFCFLAATSGAGAGSPLFSRGTPLFRSRLFDFRGRNVGGRRMTSHNGRKGGWSNIVGVERSGGGDSRTDGSGTCAGGSSSFDHFVGEDRTRK